jgi:hypothetical protein
MNSHQDLGIEHWRLENKVSSQKVGANPCGCPPGQAQDLPLPQDIEKIQNKNCLDYPDPRSLTLSIYCTCQGKAPNGGGASSFECQATRFQCRASGTHVVYHEHTPAVHSRIAISFFGRLIDKGAPYVFRSFRGIEAHLWLGVTHTPEPLGHDWHINHTSQCARKQIGLVISSFTLACRIQRDRNNQINRDRIRTPITGHQPCQRHSQHLAIGIL